MTARKVNASARELRRRLKATEHREGVLRRLLAAAMAHVPGRELRVRVADVRADLGIALEGDEVVVALGDDQ